MDFFELLKKFIENGGLFGYMGGFNAEEKGRIYNFGDLQNDIASIGGVVSEITSPLLKTAEVLK